MKDLENFKFRCSSLGTIVTKSGKLTETAKKSIIEQWVGYKYGKRKEIKSKYLDKGNEREERAITLLSEQDGVFYRNNKERLVNGFITGEPDTYLGKSLLKADKILDTKTSWDAFTFYASKGGGLDWNYEWQLKGYAWLTGCKNLELVYCLINTPAEMILNEKYRSGFKLGQPIHDTPEHIKDCQQIERNHIHDIQEFVEEYPNFEFDNALDSPLFQGRHDIPKDERIHRFKFEATEQDFERIQEAVITAKEYIKNNLL